MWSRRLRFLVSIARKRLSGQSTACPHCGSRATRRVARKFAVLQLRRCENCTLLFRYPKDDSQESWRFYQATYQEPTVTDLPSASEMQEHLKTGFRNFAPDFPQKIAELRKVVPGGRLLDYGCSWGYGLYQLQAAGYDAVGFEVSRPRAEFGRRSLGVTIFDSLDDLPNGSFDVIFSCHVVEHVPNPGTAFSQFRRLLRPGGTLVIFVPNAGGKIARERGTAWGPLISEYHLHALTAEFFAHSLPPYGFDVALAASPYRQMPLVMADRPDLEGEELMVVGHRN